MEATSHEEGWARAYNPLVMMGIEPSAEIVAIAVVYFVQGALGLARLATTFFLKVLSPGRVV